MAQRYDAVVIGAGPAGEVAVARLAKQGLRVALLERELIGGECAYWACIPSKTLLRPAEARSEARRAAGTVEPEMRWPEIAGYRDEMIRHLDDSKQIEGYEKQGVAVVKGAGRIAGPGRVEVDDGPILESERIIVATGSDAIIPPLDGLEEAGYWTNREATTIPELPSSVIVLGGGPVGVELGQMMRRYGSEVVLVEGAERLLPREDPRVGELVLDALREDGIDVRLGQQAKSVRRDSDRIVQLDDGEELRGEELVIGIGRAPRIGGIGLESVGIDADSESIDVDERCRAGDGVWAIGDVTGILPFTHVGMYQGRIAAADIAGEEVRADYRAIPRVVFCDPEVAAVGLTEEQARDRDLDISTSRTVLADAIARPWTYETEPRGELGLLADSRREVLVGAWAVGPLAGEWIHYAALAIKTETPLHILRDTVAQFPTFTEAYLKGLESLAP